MIFIKHEKGEVGYTHYMPFHEKYGLGKTKEQLEQEGILVDSVPEPEHIEGKAPILHYNPEIKELWYKYEDIPKTEEDLTKEEINQLKLDNAELMMKSAMQEMELSQSKGDIGELMIKVAMLEMGGNL